MPANDSPTAGQLTEESLARSAEAVAQMQAALQRIAEEMARSRMLVDRIDQDRAPPTK
jgi:hypothetical protein